MINVRDIIEDAFAALGAIQDGDHVDGTSAMVGERYLNQMVAALNLEDFFAFQRRTLDFLVPATKAHFLIGPEQPAGEVQPDIVSERPASITSVFAGQNPANMVSEVILVSQAKMPGFAVETTNGLPRRVTYVSSYPLGELWFDIKIPAGWTVRLCFSRSIPVLHIDDIVNVPPEYQGALTWELAKLLTARYQVPAEVKANIEQKADWFVSAIRKNTTVKTPVQAYAGSFTRSNILTRN